MSELLPCPFCGGEVSVQQEESEHSAFYVWCDTCDFYVEPFLSESHAAQRWNRRAPQQPQARVMDAPQPDWTQAEPWAMWWAVDANGQTGWFEKKPFIEDGEWFMAEAGGAWMHLRAKNGNVIDLPLGIDWRETLTKRPPAAEGGNA